MERSGGRLLTDDGDVEVTSACPGGVDVEDGRLVGGYETEAVSLGGHARRVGRREDKRAACTQHTHAVHTRSTASLPGRVNRILIVGEEVKRFKEEDRLVYLSLPRDIQVAEYNTASLIMDA